MKRLLLRAAGIAGASVRVSSKFGPGWVGAGAVSAGAGLVYMPAGVVVGGVFLLLLDRRR